MQYFTHRLAYTINGLSESSGVGRTNVFAAIKAGELKTVSVMINGEVTRRKLILPKEARRWIASFPPSEGA